MQHFLQNVNMTSHAALQMNTFFRATTVRRGNCVLLIESTDG